MVGIFREHSKGFFKDGREFEIVDFRKFAFSDTGEIHSGLMGVLITDKSVCPDPIYGVYCVSDIAKMIDYEKFNRK